MKDNNKLSSTLLKFLEEDKTKELQYVIDIIKKQNSIETIDVWDDKIYSVSHWILLINAVNQNNDLKISSNLLTWKEFSSKETASVKCVQASDHREFNHCSATFSIDVFPALIIGDSPEMQNYLVIGNELLLKLSEDESKLQSIFQKIHLHLINGGNFDELRKEMKTDVFWGKMKLIYSEVKGFFSIKIQETTDIL